MLQVTRLMCGGFIVALRNNHAICDATGIMQLMNTVGEMARGFAAPSIPPIWDRHRLTARDSPKVTFSHLVYDEQLKPDDHNLNGHTNHVQKSIVFGPNEIAALRRHVPPHIKEFSTFDILSTSLFRCRTIALGLDPEEEVRLSFAINARNVFEPPLAKGYYGNACAFPVVCAKAGDICDNNNNNDNNVGYILELIRNAKSEINEEYMRSVMDLMVMKDRPRFNNQRTYVVSDLRHLGFVEVDFGWGKPIYSGVASIKSMPHVSFFISFKNKKGQTMIMVLISLPSPIMDAFLDQLKEMLQVHA